MNNLFFLFLPGKLCKITKKIVQIVYFFYFLPTTAIHVCWEPFRYPLKKDIFQFNGIKCFGLGGSGRRVMKKLKNKKSLWETWRWFTDTLLTIVCTIHYSGFNYKSVLEFKSKRALVRETSLKSFNHLLPGQILIYIIIYVTGAAGGIRKAKWIEMTNINFLKHCKESLMFVFVMWPYFLTIHLV